MPTLFRETRLTPAESAPAPVPTLDNDAETLLDGAAEGGAQGDDDAAVDSSAAAASASASLSRFATCGPAEKYHLLPLQVPINRAT